METRRLRSLQQPAQLERLLEAFVWRGQQLPAGSYQIRDPRALPSCLRRAIERAGDGGQVWACWAHGIPIALLVAEMEFALSRERGTPVLSVARYDDGGALLESGRWVANSEGRWVRCA
jgi:hypothetical protein